MHPQAVDFTLFVKDALPEYFRNKNVLDVGSGDINGNNRHLFTDCKYEGNDVINAKNVTIVSKTKDLPFNDESFDTIVSTECFEHDPEYKYSLLKIYGMLKADGLFCFTCASTGRKEHGTRRTSPEDSYGTLGKLDDMADYYKNLTELDLNYALNLPDLFSSWATYYNSSSKDLYFVGIKKGSNESFLPEYVGRNVIKTSGNILNAAPLEHVFAKYDTDKNKEFHNYSRQYDSLLSELRGRPIKYLEIGASSGGIRAMREAFKHADCIVCIDRDAKCKGDSNSNIFVEVGDVTDPAFINTIHSQYGPFDLIIDDGSHINRDVIKSFEILFPLLSDNGLYVVEDTICYKSSAHIVAGHDTHLDYFFKYTKFLNQWRYDSTEGVKDHCVDPYKIQKKTDNVFEQSIDKIEYGCSYIAIHKKVRKHWVQSPVDTKLNIQTNYVNACNIRSDINEHLPTLRRYAANCSSVAEMGVRGVVSTWAFLQGLLDSPYKTKSLTCVDIEDAPEMQGIIPDAELNGINMRFIRGDSATTPVGPVELLFIDTWHVYAHLKRELAFHCDSVSKYIILHDTILDRDVGESVRRKMDTAEQARATGYPESEICNGLKPAVDEFLATHPEWLVREAFTNNNGLTILVRT